MHAVCLQRGWEGSHTPFCLSAVFAIQRQKAVCSHWQHTKSDPGPNSVLHEPRLLQRRHAQHDPQARGGGRGRRGSEPGRLQHHGVGRRQLRLCDTHTRAGRGGSGRGGRGRQQGGREPRTLAPSCLAPAQLARSLPLLPHSLDSSQTSGGQAPPRRHCQWPSEPWQAVCKPSHFHSRMMATCAITDHCNTWLGLCLTSGKKKKRGWLLFV